MTTTADLAKRERDFANDLGYLDGAGPEIRLHLHLLCDAVESLVKDRDALLHALDDLVRHCRLPTTGDDRFQKAVSAAQDALRGQP